MFSSRRRPSLSAALGSVIHIIARPAAGECVTIYRGSSGVYPPSQQPNGKRTRGNPRLLGRNPGPARTRQYYNKGGNKRR